MASTALATPCVDYRQYVHTTARLTTPGDAGGIVAASGRAYVADGGAGLLILDITVPDSPAILGQVDTPGSAQGVALSGNRVFVADGASGLQVVDVSVASSPQIVGSVDTPGTASDVVVSGNLAFVADQTAVQVVDVSNPLAPAIVKTIPKIISSVVDVSVDASLLHVLESIGGLRIYDVSAPLSPVLLGSYGVPGNYGKLTTAGGKAYLSTVSGMTVVDISDPTSPTFVSTISLTTDTRGDVAVVGDHVFLGAAPGNFLTPIRVFDISDPSTPIAVGVAPTSSAGLSGHRGFAVVGDRLLAAGGDVAVVDIDPPISPPPTRVDTPGDATDVAIAGTHAYVADGTSLQVVDLSAPFAPAIVGSVTVEARTVAADGSLAFVGGASSRSVIDISDPTSPAVLGSLPGAAYDVELIGTRAYATNGHLDVIAVSNPANPVVLGTSTTPATEVEVEGNYAYTGTGSDPTLWILDISGNVPALVGTASASWRCLTLAHIGDTVECGDLTHGFVTVYDVADPTQPYWETYFSDRPDDLTAQGLAYALHENGDVWVLLDDHAVSPGVSPPAVGTVVPWPLQRPDLLNLAVGNGLLLVAAGANGLVVFPAHCETPTSVVEGAAPRRVQLSPAGPNPAGGPTTLRFALPRAGSVRLNVYDVAGRRVRHLVERWYPAGEHFTAWDGLDDREQPVGSGVYFVQLLSPAGSAQARVSLLR